MKIKVESKAAVLAELNLRKFEENLKLNLDLEDSFNKFLIFKNKNIPDTDESLTRFMFMSIDWGQILKLYKDKRLEEDVLRLGMYKCEIKNFTVYYPGEAEKNVFNFEEKKEDMEEYIVIHSFIPLIEHHFENLFSELVFDYSKKDIKWIHHLQ